MLVSILNMTEDQTIQRKMNKVLQCYPEKYRFETVHVKMNGQPIHVEVISQMVEINHRKYFLSHITNITKQKQMKQEIQRLIRRLSNHAYYDYLTQTYNRTYLFNNYLRRILNRNIGIIMMDINKFKAINDTYGHLAGDFILIEVTKCIRLHMRQGDKLIRYGGDEMLLTLLDTPYETLVKMAEKIKEDIANKEFMYNKSKISCTISVGIACGVGLHRKDFELLIKKADDDLYKKNN